MPPARSTSDRPGPANRSGASRAGGVCLAQPSAQDPGHWARLRWLRTIEQLVPPDVWSAGYEDATRGLTRSLQLQPGGAVAELHTPGRRPIRVRLRLEPFSPAVWAALARELAGQSYFAAALLAGDLPCSIDELTSPLGISLFPARSNELRPGCSCAPAATRDSTARTARLIDSRAHHSPDAGPPHDARRSAWCRHACCAALLVGDRLAADPCAILMLRGVEPQELVDRVRLQRAADAGATSTWVYPAHVPGVSDHPAPALESLVEQFWSAGPQPAGLASTPAGADELPAGSAAPPPFDPPLDAPDVSHVLLRRLGSSPFAGSSLPIMGLLATCQELISAAARDRIGDAHDAPPDGMD